MAKYAESTAEEEKAKHAKEKKQRQPDNEKCKASRDGP